ncbi:MAG: class I adenylate-forming enzyme family protein [Halioglobus sp.]|nr:class I adenylate-forming enzyme family protein [Halioglobus sp.]
MSNEPMTLLQIIRQHPERPLLISDEGTFSPAALCRDAEKIRSLYPELAAANIALQFTHPAQLLLHLIALDGYARRILLLPPCLTGPAFENVISESAADFLLDATGLSTLGLDRPKGAEFDASEWLFTTSGTSGPPKVYAHTLCSLSIGVKPRQTPYCWGLAYQAHRFAGIQVIVQALISGSPLVASGTSETGKQAEYFLQNGVNALSATPSQWRNFLIHGSISRCSLRQITLGGEIADQAILSALRRQFPKARIAHIYASTEAGVGFSVTDDTAGFPEGWLGEGPPTDMKISDSDTLLIKSPAISTSASLQGRRSSDGYLDTEDCVRINNGRVCFIGRASGVINVGGNKVHPEEVENLVREIPEIQNATVNARNSSIMGQLVSLDVQAGALSDEERQALKEKIRQHCRAHLQNYKVPALINFVDTLEVAASGKLVRKGC